jgi:hypothetical protein
MEEHRTEALTAALPLEYTASRSKTLKPEKVQVRADRLGKGTIDLVALPIRAPASSSLRVHASLIGYVMATLFAKTDSADGDCRKPYIYIHVV